MEISSLYNEDKSVGTYTIRFMQILWSHNRNESKFDVFEKGEKNLG